MHRGRFFRPATGDVQMGRGLRLVLKALIVLAMLSVALVPPSLYLRDVASQMALSDAIDCVTLAINEAIHQEMSQGTYDYGYFVNLERDASGKVTAVTSNMARINMLSSKLLQDVVSSADGGEMEIHVPLGNMIGTNLLHGRGPDVPVKIIMLTSSSADFRNDISSAGINQIRHQIVLEVMVDIDVLIPWETLSTRVVSEVLVAETVIVGSVPYMYFETQK